MRLDPDTTMVSPCVPVVGSIEVNTGPDPEAGAEVVVGVAAGWVVVVTDVAPGDAAAGPPSWPAWAVGGASGAVWVDGVVRPDEDGDPPPLSLTAQVASTAATTAIRLTDTINSELLRRCSP